MGQRCSSAWPAVTPTPAPTPTHEGLSAQRPFYVAHRGGGANWPEMTAYAYRQAAALPFVQAIEISVCRSADGVLVCSHDPTTLRVTGADHEISTTNWSTLSRLMVTPEYTDNPDQPARPFSRLDEVLDDYIQRLVVFIEPKTSDANDPLLLKLIMLNQPQRTVWKQPVNSPKFLAAKEHGLRPGATSSASPTTWTTWSATRPTPRSTCSASVPTRPTPS